MRGAAIPIGYIAHAVHISIHAPHAGSGCVARNNRVYCLQISIHAPHAGSGSLNTTNSQRNLLFQSTLPMRGAALKLLNPEMSQRISIHAPHAGSGKS